MYYRFNKKAILSIKKLDFQLKLRYSSSYKKILQLKGTA